MFTQQQAIEQQIYAWFEHFHANPEISWEEVETTNTLARILDDLNVPYKRFDDVTGLVAEIGQGEDVVAVRADIDALWQEVNGTWQANHSCGHDANMSMVLGALLYVRHEAINKRIRFIFQPAEEKGNGAISMIDRGALDDVTHLFGVHLRPQEELSFGQVTPAIHHGAAYFLQGKIHGVDAHGARPHQGQSAIDVFAAMHQQLAMIHIDPFDVCSAKITKMVADGGSVNIIAGTGEFAIDVRAQKNDVLQLLKTRIEEMFARLEQQFNVTLQWQWEDFTPGAEVSAEAVAIAERALQRTFPAEAITAPVHTPGSDDFHCYTIAKPTLHAAMIGIGADLAPGLHHPYMTFNREALLIGAKAVAATLLEAAK
ncbi:MAG: amidohydrolase [Caryophanon sp.]|nr:amidohydrolase [Caryophanon sp.]